MGVLVGGGGFPGRVLPLGTAGHDLLHLGLGPLVGLQRDRADQAARQLQEGVHPDKSDDRHLGARPERHHVSPAPVGWPWLPLTLTYLYLPTILRNNLCVLPSKHPLWKRLGISAKKELTNQKDKCWKGQGWGQCKVKKVNALAIEEWSGVVHFSFR